MIVTCNSCESSFKIDDSLIKDAGSKVRCSKCSSVFVVYPETPASETADETEDFALDMEEGLGADLDFDEKDDDLAMAESSDDELPDLEDMLDLDEGEPAEEEMAEAASDELELDLDMDLDADEDAIAAEKPGLEEEEVDLDTELESLAQEAESELKQVEMADSDLADLDMDLDDLDKVEETDLDLERAEPDLNLEIDAEETPPPATEAVAASAESDELDLSDLEDLVASSEEPEKEDMAVEAADDADLDLSDLDDVLGAEEEPVEEEPVEEEPVIESQDYDLELEPEAHEPSLESAEDIEKADELDLSDLDGIMELDETPAAASSDEDLELDFEVEDSVAKKAPAESTEISEQLEMSDLEQMLESDETPASTGEEDLDLDLDFEGAVEADVASEKQTGSDGAEFLDIEKMLEEGAEKGAGAKRAEEPVELDLEAVLDEAAKSDEPELELDLDLGDDISGAESALAASDSGETDLDFKLLDSDEETLRFGATQASATIIDDGSSDGGASGASSDGFPTDDFAETHDYGGRTDVMEAMGADIGGAPLRRKKSRKSLIAVFVLLLLCLIGYVVIQNLGIQIPYVSDFKIPYLSNVKIPYLSGLLKSEAQDMAGNLKITPLGMTITHKFVQNRADGDIFVIQGQVRNEYDHPRSYIKITAKLYVKGQALAKTATVYCGNVLSDSDLTNMDMAAINKHLQNRFGDNRSNIKVTSGKTVPFIIVFNRLPPDLDEYTVEVAGSSS
jgi:pilus assembly protein FimV